MRDSISTTTCELLDLSTQFDVHIDFKRHQLATSACDSCIVKLVLAEKETKQVIDSILVQALFYYGSVMQDCNNVRSHPKDTHLDRLAYEDRNNGDIIVADFNFDKKDDIAVIYDSGGNSGPLYNYYLQGPDRKFVLNAFLTDTMGFLPVQINRKKKTLMTIVRAGVAHRAETIYKLNPKTNRWKLQSYRRKGY